MHRILIVLMISMAASGLAVGVSAQTSDIDRAIERNPALAAIIGIDPAREDQIRRRLHDAYALGIDELEQEALRIGREVGQQLMPKLIAYSPDETVLQFLRITNVALEEAAAQSGTHCHTFLIGGAGGGPMPDFSPATGKGLGDALLEITVSAGERRQQRLLDPEEMGTLLGIVVDRTIEVSDGYPLNFDAVANLPYLRDDDAKTDACWTSIYFYEAILDLPPADAAALFRTMLATS